MYKDKKILSIIPARKNSKGLPSKNIKDFNGLPLISWSILHAKESKYIDDVVVTSDCEEVLSIAKENSVLFLRRPDKLATDDSHVPEAILHVLSSIDKIRENTFDLVVLLQPTSPLRAVRDIDGAIEFLCNSRASAVVSVCESTCNLNYINVLPEDLSMKNFLGNNGNLTNRQDHPKNYQLNGAVYAAYRRYLVENRGFYGEDTFAYIMPKERSIDIDDVYDFRLAEFFVKMDRRK